MSDSRISNRPSSAPPSESIASRESANVRYDLVCWARQRIEARQYETRERLNGTLRRLKAELLGSDELEVHRR